MTERALLYSFRRCPYAIRARLALAMCGVDYELREVVLRDKPAQLLAASPKGTVPVLVVPGGGVIDESLLIMQWALRQPHRDGQRGLQAHDDDVHLINCNDSTFKYHLDRYKYPHRYPMESGGTADEFARVHRGAGAYWLAQLNRMLQSSPGGSWLFGHHPSLGDLATLPFVRQFAHTDAAWFAAQPWPALQQWLARFEASALYAQVMQKSR